MCGIAGVVALDGRPGDAEATDLVAAMCDRQHHRGPDDVGIETVGAATLGLTRLSIVDLPGGHQPLSNADGTVWVTLNGEIYNHVELRRQLRQRGHRFRTAGDAEVIVHLYEESGIDCLHHLNGMFAVAIWDARRHELYLARDRIGIKPIYWTRLAADRRLAWASELKALLAVPEVGTTVDLEAIADYLTLLYVPQPRTPFVGVHKLAPGTYLRVADGLVDEHVWWRWPLPRPAPSATTAGLEEQIRHLVVDAVDLQLRADVPVGVFASGGMDSSAILWAASELGADLDAFCVEFEDLAVDTPFAQQAASAAGLDLTVLHLSSDRTSELLPTMIHQVDEPLADPAIVPSALVAEAAARHVKVILSGTGGDEVFGGYGRYTLPDPAAYAAHLNVHPAAEVRRALGLAPHAPGDVTSRLGGLLSAAGDDHLAAAMYVDGRLYLPEDLCMVLDKTSMASSLEARVPLLDHRLVELVAALPGPTRIGHGDLKRLFRRALRGRVPDAILDRPKAGFSPPVQRWWEGPLGRDAGRLLADGDAPVRRLLGPFIDRWLAPGAGPEDLRALRGWAMLVLDLWWRAYVDTDDVRGASVRELAIA